MGIHLIKQIKDVSNAFLPEFFFNSYRFPHPDWPLMKASALFHGNTVGINLQSEGVMVVGIPKS